MKPSVIRHGTLSGYNHDGCRCPDCRAVKAAWHRDTGANVRIGKRAEQKRAWDRKHADRKAA